MENVSMLRSETHRFFESEKDNSEIDLLIEAGFYIPKREDVLVLSNECPDGFNMEDIDGTARDLSLPKDLGHMLSVLKKDVSNKERLNKYIEKYAEKLDGDIKAFIDSIINPTKSQERMITELNVIQQALRKRDVSLCYSELESIIATQKMIESIHEIKDNKLIGAYELTDTNHLLFRTHSYSVIDYVNAVLGNDYVQTGDTVCAQWFGVPQERNRYIVIGVRRDVYNEKRGIVFPKEPEQYEQVSVGDAINDLERYDVGYSPDYGPLKHLEEEEIVSEYAKKMRGKCKKIYNHITAKTRDTALLRFRVIKQGGNFHTLAPELKSSYSNPSRTQNTIYLRLDDSRPSGTVVNVRKSMWIHPHLNRAISVREAARLQSFPDNFVFEGKKDSQYQQVGNAVPPLLARTIAKCVVKNIK